MISHCEVVVDRYGSECGAKKIVRFIFDASALLELVHAEEYGLKRDSRNGRDLSDGSNSKLSCSYVPLNAQQTAFGWRFKIGNVESGEYKRANMANILH